MGVGPVIPDRQQRVLAPWRALAEAGGVGKGGPPVTRASQDWVGENVTVKSKKSHIGEEVGGPGAYKRWRCTPFQASFWGRG